MFLLHGADGCGRIMGSDGFLETLHRVFCESSVGAVCFLDSELSCSKGLMHVAIQGQVHILGLVLDAHLRVKGIIFATWSGLPSLTIKKPFLFLFCSTFTSKLGCLAIRKEQHTNFAECLPFLKVDVYSVHTWKSKVQMLGCGRWCPRNTNSTLLFCPYSISFFSFQTFLCVLTD